MKYITLINFRIIFICLVLGLVSCQTDKKKTLVLEKGISLDLATYRKQQIEDVVYSLNFNIPEAKEEAIVSQLLVRFKIQDLEHPLYLDFNEKASHLKEVIVNGNEIEIKHEKEHLIIEQSYLELGENKIEVSFLAGELSLNRNQDYLYTLLVPDRASTLFPCFDQPDIKAHYKLEITAPKNWKVLCGAPLLEVQNEGVYTRYKYKPSDKMSTYLFSFVAGVFEEYTKQLGALNMKLLYRENNQEKIDASMGEIFRLHNESVNFLEDYTQCKFPFQKLDFASIPGFQYGGMEHVGAIQYRESSIFLDHSATQNQKMGRGKLIAHETAHMWFGDLVTMKWFDDVWLKEVFANFLADKIANPAFPDVNHNLQFMISHYRNAYGEDRTQGATPIKQQLDNLKNAGTLYGRIIYNKAPIMMRQLEAVVGANAFREGMRKYIKNFAGANADWNDLVALLDAETHEDLKQWSDVWVYQSGRPIISDNIRYKDNKIETFEISQKAEDRSNTIWSQTFNLGLVYQDTVKVFPVALKDQKQCIEKLAGLLKPKAIIYNYNAFGYGVFPLNGQSIKHIPLLEDDVARSYSYINLHENMLNGNISPKIALETLVSGLATEKKETVLGVIAGNLSSVFWKYLNEEERLVALQKLEPLLMRKLKNRNLEKGIKKTFFKLYQGLVYSEGGKDFLYKLWKKDEVINNLVLNENDYTSITTTLALFKHSESDIILKEAKAAITNPDRQKRFEFLLPSLSNNEAERDAFMVALKDPKHREKESWVLSALHNIHHPLRQESSKKHLKQCLDLLEEVQLTGDIFFPKGWLNATVGSYSSEYALHVVDVFLKENPNFPKALKNKLLQSADGLYRAQIINQKE